MLTASIAAGNTAIIKVSSKSPACSAALRELIYSCFPEESAAVVEGGHAVPNSGTLQDI
ncbi:MAG: aldehyde dehydrogenase family protein [Firmicutes bacterium]|nr:aldehyde dehydrogenase family protein [Bacillota bacterium]